MSLNDRALPIIIISMKKIILFTVIGAMVASIAGAAMEDNNAAVSAALDRMSRRNDSPRWTSSLVEVEGAAADLVDANRKLMTENQSLLAAQAALEADIRVQRQKNSDQASVVAERRAELNLPASGRAERQKLSQSEKDIQQARGEVSLAQARLKAVDSKLALQKLKVQGLEIEKQSLLMDRDARTVLTLGTLKQSIVSLKGQVDSQKGQIDFVRQKISGLKSVDRPDLKEAGQLIADNVKLKSDLALLMAQRTELLAQIDAAVEKKNKAGTSADVRRLADLSARKAGLESRIAAAQARLDSLTAQANTSTVNATALTAQIKGLEDENKALEESMGNVRENIAVLEYRMNSLTRYKNRNSNKN